MKPGNRCGVISQEGANSSRNVVLADKGVRMCFADLFIRRGLMFI